MCSFLLTCVTCLQYFSVSFSSGYFDIFAYIICGTWKEISCFFANTPSRIAVCRKQIVRENLFWGIFEIDFGMIFWDKFEDFLLLLLIVSNIRF